MFLAILALCSCEDIFSEVVGVDVFPIMINVSPQCEHSTHTGFVFVCLSVTGHMAST